MAREGNKPDRRQEVAAVDEAAALWSERLREAGDDSRVRRAFDAWCAQGQEHLAAYRRVEAAQETIHTISDSPELLALRHESLARIAKNQVAQTPVRVWRRRFGAVAAALAVVLVGGLLAFDAQNRQLAGDIYDRLAAIATGTEIYRTAVGEQLAVTLDDGSKLTLNTTSRVKVAYRDDIRSIELERGQALFEVAKDRSRPFIVTAGGRRITALGTAFDVRFSGAVFEVTLLEGRVTVEDGIADTPRSEKKAAPVENAAEESSAGFAAPVPATTELHPGEQFSDSPAAPPVIRVADTKRVTSWRDGRVIFENDRLSAAVNEMNRYSRRRVRLQDDGLGDLRVSGAFDVGQTALFVEALTDYFPIVIAEQDSDRIVLAWQR